MSTEDIIDGAAISYGDGNTYLDGEMALAALAKAGYEVVPSGTLAENERLKVRLSEMSDAWRRRVALKVDDK